MRGKSSCLPTREGWCACAAMLMPFDVQTVLYGGPRSRAWRVIDPLAIGDELSPTGICVDSSLSSRRFSPVSASFNLGGRSERSLRSSSIGVQRQLYLETRFRRGLRRRVSG